MKISAESHREAMKLLNKMKTKQEPTEEPQTIEGLAAYISDYINYEIDKQPHGYFVSAYTVLDAMEAYKGGAR